MNELIKKLAEQATSYTWNGNDTTEELDAELFADLIVRECIGVMNSTIDESIDLERKLGETAYWIESDIKKYFGVE